MKLSLIFALLTLPLLGFGQLVTLPKALTPFYHSGEQFSDHHEVRDFFEQLQKMYPDNIKLQTYGYTEEGRPLFVAYMSSTKNLQQLETVRTNHLKGNENDNTAIAWFSYNVHGNESCGTEAAMETAFRLLNDNAKLLETTVVILDPCLNPDGRDRYVHYFRQYKNKVNTYQVESAEHDEIWPGGRPNHYLFDLNRDWAWLTQVESKQRIQLYQQWLPHVHVDFHEQSMNEPYYFPPAAEPYHEKVTEWQRSFQKEIGKRHASYFDKKNWLYFSNETFDLLYPSYGDTYPTFQGAIGMTYEQGGSGRAGLAVVTAKLDTLTLKDRIEHHTITGISTLETIQAHHKRLLDEFRKFHEAPKEKAVNSYVLDGNAPNIKSLLALFQLHNITYTTYQGEDNMEFKGFDYFNPTNQKIRIKQKDIVVSNRQEKGCLVDVLLEPSTKLSDSLTYDITAWSLPYAYGVPCGRIQKEVGPFETQALIEETTSVPVEEPYALVLPWTNLNAVKTLNYLLDSGYSVSRTERDILTENQRIKAGSLVLLKSDNKEKSLLRAFQELEKKFQTTCLALSTGWNPNGLELGTSYIKPIMKPRVGVLFNHECSSLSLGEIWYFLDAELGIDHQLIRESSEGGISLWNFDVIILPEGYSSENKEQLKSFIQEGGICIVLGNAASNFMSEEYGMNTSSTDKPLSSKELGNYGNLDRANLSETLVGAIYACEVDTTHPLAFGYQKEYYTLRLSADCFPFEGQIIQKVKNTNGWISGFAGHHVKNQQLGAVTVGQKRIGEGSIVFFFDNPLFRGFWQNGKLQVANALYFLR